MPHMRLAVAAVILASLTWTALAQDSPESPLFDAPPTPSPSEKVQVIEKAREFALQYTANLPNFIATSTVRRHELDKRKQLWKLEDTLTYDVAFSKEEGESYKLLAIDGKPTKKTKVDGLKFGGDFGSLLQEIFQPGSEAKFQWERWTNLRGRPAHVFSYRIELSRSGYHLSFSKLFKHYSSDFAFGGLVYVDRETHQVMRFTHAAEGIPANWPVTGVPGELDYGFFEIDAKQFLLPLRADVRLLLRDGDQNRNVTEFGNYRKFTSEATIKFEKQ